MPSLPQSLYKEGTEFDWDGRMTDRLVVSTENEYDSAIASGWKLPEDYWAADEAPKPRRGRPPAK